MVESDGILCAECGRAWVDPKERWQSFLDDDLNAVPFCPECAEREFSPGPDESGDL